MEWTMPRQSEVTRDICVGRVMSVTKMDQDMIINGVLRVTDRKWDCRAKGLLESDKIRTHSDDESFSFLVEYGWRRRQQIRIGDRRRMESIGQVERSERRATNAAVVDGEFSHQQHGGPISVSGAENAELLRD